MSLWNMNAGHFCSRTNRLRNRTIDRHRLLKLLRSYQHNNIPPKEHEFVKGRTKTTSSKEMSVNMLLFFTTLTNLNSKLQGSGR